MISSLGAKTSKKSYKSFANQLVRAGFTGDIDLCYSSRTVSATDNSIYQILPEGILYPKTVIDISLMLRLSFKKTFSQIVFSARGGGTGTNGQSLTPGFIVDLSRYMNRVISIDPEKKTARVQAGVVKDYLNEMTRAYGLFFAPELSTSNRATIGGMVNTDACGYGSIVYGKTHHHVLETTCILSDGSVVNLSALNSQALEEQCVLYPTLKHICHGVKQVEKEYRQQIKQVFPKLNRSLTGYDLANIYNRDNYLDLNALICGSEGTLAVVAEITVNLEPVPKVAALAIVLYDKFVSSLQDVPLLMTTKPTGIETIDSTVLNLARKNINIWSDIKYLLPSGSDTAQGINFVSFEDEIQQSLSDRLKLFEALQEKNSEQQRQKGYRLLTDEKQIAAIWHMRKQAVGLLANMNGNARPIPFVEDVAVPPEHLAEFIEKFCQVLDKYHLKYGMFGHSDAGVLHVRPALDMKNLADEKLVRIITDEIVQLAKQYGGVLWGEHGKGIRSEYAPVFFGPVYPALMQIKQIFDPDNRLNPGKIATPEKQIPLIAIDEAPTRGQSDRKISKPAMATFASGLWCNGNGACFNYSASSAMCPTFKATGDRRQSPKGRSALIREWLTLQSDKNPKFLSNPVSSQGVLGYIRTLINSTKKIIGIKDFSHEVQRAMDTCMSCKACVGQCPVQINTPDMRSRFFELYYHCYARPLKHTAMSHLEGMTPLLSRFKKQYHHMLDKRWFNFLGQHVLGLVDLPRLSELNPDVAIKETGATLATPALLAALLPEERNRCVILVPDAFTYFFEIELVCEFIRLIKWLGLRPLMSPFNPSGKVLHVYGYRSRFYKTAKMQLEQLRSLANFDVPLVGLDAATTLIYRDEYKEVINWLQGSVKEDDRLQKHHSKSKVHENAQIKNKSSNEVLDGQVEKVSSLSALPEVLLISEWLTTKTDIIKEKVKNVNTAGEFILLTHCTEATNLPESSKMWVSIFKAAGITLHCQATGCCGMSGAFGHEAANQAVSRKLFSLSWQPLLEQHDDGSGAKSNSIYLATGFSCRCQARRLAGKSLHHPIHQLLKVLLP